MIKEKLLIINLKYVGAVGHVTRTSGGGVRDGVHRDGDANDHGVVQVPRASRTDANVTSRPGACHF